MTLIPVRSLQPCAASGNQPSALNDSKGSYPLAQIEDKSARFASGGQLHEIEVGTRT
jgi:hypothetical protein